MMTFIQLFFVVCCFRWRWRQRREEAGASSPEPRPNLIVPATSHVSIFKFCLYFDVEARIIPIEEGKYALDLDKAIKQCDENTIGVMAILGNTLTGEFDDIKELNNRLLKLQSSKGWTIPIHVDAASGGYIAPFLFPKLQWDFRLELVRSINVSAHKFGQVYAGLGFVVWKEKEDLPEDLIFHVNYLGSDEPTFGINFSRSASTVVAQYYNFLRLGREGYTRIAQVRSSAIERTYNLNISQLSTLTLMFC